MEEGMETTSIVVNFIASSDSQLAVYSQVCKAWRKAAVDGVVQHAMNGITVTTAVDRSMRETTTINDGRTTTLLAGGGDGGKKLLTINPAVQNLLLTEMAKRMALHRIQNNNRNNHRRFADDDLDDKVVVADANERGLFCLAWFEPSGIQTTSIHVANNFGHREEVEDEGRRRETKNLKITRECCHEWRGYRTPLEVLRPFGYDDAFVSEVIMATLQEASERGLLSKSQSLWHEPDDGICKSGAASYDHHLPTFAVSGATLARPEGHCLCLDEEYTLQYECCWQDETAAHLPPLLSRKHRRPSTMKEVTTRFKTCMVDLLPTVVVQDDDDHHQRRGIRFLNAEESHATRLITPFFKCGGVKGPVTMFLVADSEEEGCWVSGRNSRFEVGHRFTIRGKAHTVTLVGNRHDGSFDDEDEEEEEEEDFDPPFQCLCCFQSDDPFRAKHLSEEAPSEDRIFRGCLTPAERTKVSCYCAVFDEKKSMIRINAKEETQHRVSRVGDSSHEITCDPEMNGAMVGSGVLNGLSLGADHQFDHSLSYDMYGSDTILYELAVFSGRMNLEDIQKMEQHLMKKHGIIAQS